MPEPKDVERCEYMHEHEAIVNQVNQNKIGRASCRERV